MNIVSLHNVTLKLATTAILDNVSWQINARDRIALVGRNGAGKSTLMSLLQGQLQTDSGQVQFRQGLIVSGLLQEVPSNPEATVVYHVLTAGLGEAGEVLRQYYDLKPTDHTALATCQQAMDNHNLWARLAAIDSLADHLHINIHDSMQSLSGGMKRRVLLAQALLVAPDLLLLDEPTNHLDLATIEWLETYLKTYAGSVVVVTHDKAFLQAVTTQIVEIDRGQLYSYPCNYQTYLIRKEQRLSSEMKQQALYDKRLATEETWIRSGIQARRTRNEGRVRALKVMRDTYQKRRLSQGTVEKILLDTERSGQLVCEADGLTYQLHDKILLDKFTHIISKGDKIGIIGPNGCGKTTLVRLLLGELQPTAGRLRTGTGLSIAYFDQLRQTLQETETVIQNVADGADYVTVGGKEKHVVSYLKDFLFTSDRFNQPIASLSGGERNRLLLAKIFARPMNFLVLDEPTNDLDMETLELLADILVEYTGTLLLISHDRDFINQVTTSLLVYEGAGHFQEYFGGYDDYQRICRSARAADAVTPPQQTITPVKAKPDVLAATLNASEHRELSKLILQIETIEEKIAHVHLTMAEPGFYQGEATHVSSVHMQLTELQLKLSALNARWESLENRK